MPRQTPNHHLVCLVDRSQFLVVSVTMKVRQRNFFRCLFFFQDCPETNKLDLELCCCWENTYPTNQNMIPPSDPPLANMFSWIGCQATAAKHCNIYVMCESRASAYCRVHQAQNDSLFCWCQLELTCCFFFMALERLHFFFHVPDVEQLYQVISRCRQKPVSIYVPLDFHHSVLVCVPEKNS